MLKIENLSFSYRRKGAMVFDGFSMNLEKGKVCGLLGENGVGKSTLLYLIAGLLTPRNGKVYYKGVDTRLRKPETLSDIFIVPEEFTLPKVSLDKYVKNNAQFYPSFSQEDLNRYLSVFDMDANLNMGELSMGQKKKAFMCFALAANTSLLLMDEPTNGLDIPGKSQFRKFIASGMSDDRNIIISTHQVRDIDKILDHVVIMNNHKVLLNTDISGITEKLRFVTTDDKDVIADALYSQYGIGGNSVILRNDNGEDSELDLEMLFWFILEKPEMVKEMFNKNNIRPWEK